MYGHLKYKEPTRNETLHSHFHDDVLLYDDALPGIVFSSSHNNSQYPGLNGLPLIGIGISKH